MELSNVPALVFKEAKKAHAKAKTSLEVAVFQKVFYLLLSFYLLAFFHFILSICFGDQVFSLGFVPGALLNSPAAILKVTPPLPVPSQEKRRRVTKLEHTGKISRSGFN